MSRGMLGATAQPPFDDIATGLEQMAQALATAHARGNAMARGGDPLHWREAALVWPLFTSSLLKKSKG